MDAARFSREIDLDLPRWIKFEGTLGEGGQAFVVSAYDSRLLPNEEPVGPVAIKCYSRKLLENERRRRRILREVINHRRLKHPHVVGFREVRLTKNYLLIVLQIVNGGNLKRALRNGPLSENDARWYYQQLVCGVDYCHRLKILNRDITPENILLHEVVGEGRNNRSVKSVMLCDFGLSRDEQSVEMHGSIRPISIVGKRGYIAPEVVSRPALAPELTAVGLKKSDIFSTGVCLYQMLVGLGSFPQESDDERTTTSDELAKKLARSLTGPFELVPGLKNVSEAQMSEECKDFLNKILQPNPQNRLEMKDIWEHSWFKHELPENFTDYNDELTTEEFISLNMRGVQTEEEVKERINASPDFTVENGSWY